MMDNSSIRENLINTSVYCNERCTSHRTPRLLRGHVVNNHAQGYARQDGRCCAGNATAQAGTRVTLAGLLDLSATLRLRAVAWVAFAGITFALANARIAFAGITFAVTGARIALAVIAFAILCRFR